MNLRMILSGLLLTVTGLTNLLFSAPQNVRKYSVLERIPNQEDAKTDASTAERVKKEKSSRVSLDATSEVSKALPRDGQKELNQLMTRMALKHIPHQFTEDKDWGKTDRRWDGVKVRREGLKIKTKRKWKEVNHGTWKKYSVQLRNPETEFQIELKNLREVSEGTAGFDLHFIAHLDIQARQSKWVKGVQLYSLSANGHARVRLVINMEMNMKLDFANLPPDFVLSPKATGADLIVDEFRIDRVGKVGGEIAQQVTRFARQKLDEKIVEKKKKLLDKINREIQENSDKLRLSSSKLDKKWMDTAAPFLKRK